METFVEFVDKKKRKSKQQLELITKILRKEGLVIGNHLEEDEPYVFLKSTNSGLSFDGIRIYKIGSDIAYRVQKEEQTHPYGKAYSLDLEGMYHDLLSDNMNEEKAAKEVMKSVVQELKTFFEKSLNAEKELQIGDYDKKTDPMGKILARNMGTDYSNMVHNSTPSSPL